ncbi:MAG: DinB family protein [Ignavibacteriota bacterium]
MSPAVDRLAKILADTPARLADISDSDASSSAADRWSKKQILGHLIDSAANNHQRFVRAQLAANYEGPSYEQEKWVAAQSYSIESWADLVNLWLLYNRHLLHIVRTMPEAPLGVPCAIGNSAPVPLAEVISSYVDHMEHHLAQILG